MDIAIIDKAIDAFDEFYRAQDKLLGGKFNDLGVEGRRRIIQAKTLVQKIITLSEVEGQAVQVGLKMPPPKAGQTHEDYFASSEYQAWKSNLDTPETKAAVKRFSEITDELELSAECFYWIAGRTRTIIKKLPGLSSFEATGVRNVRNKLIEHPEKGDSGVVFGGFGWGGPNGPVVKAIRLEQQINIFPDKGLYLNAQEFFKNVQAVCEKAINTPQLILDSVRRAD